MLSEDKSPDLFIAMGMMGGVVGSAFGNSLTPSEMFRSSIILDTRTKALFGLDTWKDVEMFLINRQIAYRSGERRMHIGDETRGVPNFSVSTEDADFYISVFTPRDLRAQIRNTPEGRPLERVRRDWLDAALDANNAAGT